MNENEIKLIEAIREYTVQLQSSMARAGYYGTDIEESSNALRAINSALNSLVMEENNEQHWIDQLEKCDQYFQRLFLAMKQREEEDVTLIRDVFRTQSQVINLMGEAKLKFTTLKKIMTALIGAAREGHNVAELFNKCKKIIDSIENIFGYLEQFAEEDKEHLSELISDLTKEMNIFHTKFERLRAAANQASKQWTFTPLHKQQHPFGR